MIYVRVSFDPEDKALSVQRQEEACRKHAEHLGAEVVGVYRDNGVRATEARGSETQWAAMVRHLRRHDDVDTVIAYDGTRLSRNLDDFARLSEIARANGSLRVSQVKGGEADLADAVGFLTTGLATLMGATESRQTSQRVALWAEQQRNRGNRHGSRRPFGWQHAHGDTGPWTKRVPSEARLIRDAAKRILAGETASSVARDWNRLGVPRPRSDSPAIWQSRDIERILTSGLTGCVITYKGEVWLHPETGQPVLDQSAKPILDRQTWFAVREEFARRKHERQRSGRYGRPSPRRLLSGIMRCSKCGRPVGASAAKNKRGTYKCKREAGGCGGTVIMRHLADNYVSREVVRAAEEDRARFEPRGHNMELIAARHALHQADRRQAELAEQYATGNIPIAAFTKASAALGERLGALRAEVAKLRAVEAAQVAHSGVRQRWGTWPEGQRRALVGEYCQSIVLHPVARGAQWDPEHQLVEIVWREGKAPSPRQGRRVVGRRTLSTSRA